MLPAERRRTFGRGPPRTTKFAGPSSITLTGWRSTFGCPGQEDDPVPGLCLQASSKK